MDEFQIKHDVAVAKAYVTVQEIVDRVEAYKNLAIVAFDEHEKDVNNDEKFINFQVAYKRYIDYLEKPFSLN